MTDLLREFKGIPFKDALEKLKASSVLFATSSDDNLVEVARAIRSNGVEAGMASIIAILSVKENGVGFTVNEAIRIYKREIARTERKTGKDPRLERVKKAIRDMEYMLAWSSQCRECAYIMPEKRKLPVKPTWRASRKWCGMANIMLYMSLAELSQDGSCNTDMLAANGIMEFLKFKTGVSGSKEKKNERQADAK